jgi:hypothetical protein
MVEESKTEAALQEQGKRPVNPVFKAARRRGIMGGASFSANAGLGARGGPEFFGDTAVVHTASSYMEKSLTAPGVEM